MATGAKRINSDAVIVHPEVFTFAVPSAETVTSPAPRATAIDLKLKHTCNHRLSSGTYKLENCPRCLGLGHYFDIKFTATGQLSAVTLEDKLIQALEKLAITRNNQFHPEIVVGIKKWLGALSNRENLGVIKNDIVSALATFRETQKTVSNLSPRARISSIDSISVDISSPDALYYNIVLTTVSGKKAVVSGTITPGELTV